MSGARPFTVAVLTKNRTNPAYVGARSGADRVVAAAGGEARHYVPTVPDSVEEQIELLRQALRERVDAIVVAPTHPTALLPTFDEARSAAIPLVTLVSRARHEHVSCHVGSDDVRLAAAITDYLCRHLQGEGRLAYIGGHPNSSTSLGRDKGFHRALEDWPSVLAVAEAEGLYQREPARDAMRRILAARQEIDGIVTANDLMALGILEALEEAGRRLPVVGVNAIPDAVTAVREGRMLATAAFDAMAMACIAAEAAVRVLRGQPVPREVVLPVAIVDRRNAEIWDRPYAARPVPTWDEALAGA